jgi:AcrR family transcriptional regulator
VNRLGAREANRLAVRTRLLDTAEELFAERGFYGVGLRELAEAADTRLAAVNEIFGGKENLFRDVLVRRIRPLNDERRELLAAVPGRGPRARRVRALVEAFVLPMVRRAEQDRGWRQYLRLAAQLNTARHPVLLLVAEDYNAIAQEVIAQLRDLFPAAGEPALADAYLYVVAVSLQPFADTGRVRTLAPARPGRAPELRRRCAGVVPFAAAGITALLTDAGRG